MGDCGSEGTGSLGASLYRPTANALRLLRSRFFRLYMYIVPWRKLRQATVRPENRRVRETYVKHTLPRVGGTLRGMLPSSVTAYSLISLAATQQEFIRLNRFTNGVHTT